LAQYFVVHPENPQPRLLQQAAAIIRDGGVVAIPTDCCYALACHTGDKEAMEKLRSIRGVDDRHHFTLMCADLAAVGQFARVDNATYRLLRASLPGAYTVILEGTKDLPRRLLHPKRKTIGVRIPDHVISLALIAALGEPLLTTTLILPGEDDPLTEGWEIRDRLEHDVDLVLDGGSCGGQPTTVVDMTAGVPELIRAGRGDPSAFGL
jgi:tRNA threonylcarbamoyl adenosine modification protein (Sua5/YciO/YrdC/YwlC family)